MARIVALVVSRRAGARPVVHVLLDGDAATACGFPRVRRRGRIAARAPLAQYFVRVATMPDRGRLCGLCSARRVAEAPA